jgi:Na+/alanine symporter
VFPFAQIFDVWYALPLIVAVSLVYAATRHEEPAPLLMHALRVGAWITGVMVALFVLLTLISGRL